MLSLVPSLLVLGALAIAAAYLAVDRPSRRQQASERNGAARAFFWTILAQSAHFIEEAMTGFHESFPAVFGLPPIPFPVFVAFNLLWIVVWLGSIPGITKPLRFAFFTAWFLGFAGVLNLVAHPVLAIVTGGYFPGLMTAPLVGLFAVWLCVRLHRASGVSVSAT